MRPPLLLQQPPQSGSARTENLGNRMPEASVTRHTSHLQRALQLAVPAPAPASIPTKFKPQPRKIQTPTSQNSNTKTRKIQTRKLGGKTKGNSGDHSRDALLLLRAAQAIDQLSLLQFKIGNSCCFLPAQTFLLLQPLLIPASNRHTFSLHKHTVQLTLASQPARSPPASSPAQLPLDARVSVCLHS